MEAYRYPVSRPEITRDILERTFSICPELAPPDVRAQREPTVEDIVIIEEGCGLRPWRAGGIRLEVEWSEAGGRKVPVVFNYGRVCLLGACLSTAHVLLKTCGLWVSDFLGISKCRPHTSRRCFGFRLEIGRIQPSNLDEICIFTGYRG
jgi:hypothetical protein